jgi:hypothetical protein
MDILPPTIAERQRPQFADQCHECRVKCIMKIATNLLGKIKPDTPAAVDSMHVLEGAEQDCILQTTFEAARSRTLVSF